MELLATLFIFAGQVHAYSYSQGTATMQKPIELSGEGGATLTLTSGPVSLEMNSYPKIFGGDGSVVISNASGKVTITIPRDTFKSAWVFFAPAPRLRGEFALSGRDSTRVDQDDAREDWVTCSVPATELLVTGDDGRPYLVPSRDPNGRTSSSQMRLRLCAQTVNGQMDIRQLTGFATTCDGRQKVLKQVERTQQLFTIEILDPASNQAVGKIEASAPDQTTTNEKVVRKLTPCAR